MKSIELRHMGRSSPTGLLGQGSQALTYPRVSMHDYYDEPRLASSEQDIISCAYTNRDPNNDGPPSSLRRPNEGATLDDGSAPNLSPPLEEPPPIIQFEPYVDNESPQSSLSFPPFSCRIKNLKSRIRLKWDGGQATNDLNVKEFGFKSMVVSRKHCELGYRNGQWYVRDIGSAGGTFLNKARLPGPGEKIPPTVVNDGDIIRLGSTAESQGPSSRPVAIKVRCTGPSSRFRLHERNHRWKMQMFKNGWCIHRIQYLADRHGTHLVQYLSELQPLRKEDHGACIDQPACIAYNVNPATYRTRHVDPDCSCEFVGPPYDEVKRIWSGGGVPLISIQQDSDTNFTIKALKRDPYSRYVAITHVWADGLGNPVGCALPICQIKKIYSALFTMKGLTTHRVKPVIWMDTLCIPVKDEDVALRIGQIDRMASIYKGA